jgi:hypothetical protein
MLDEPLLDENRRSLQEETIHEDTIDKMVPVRYEYKKNKKAYERLYGIYTTDHKFFPSNVIRPYKSSKFVNSEYMNIFFLATLKKQREEIKALQKKVTFLEQFVATQPFRE